MTVQGLRQPEWWKRDFDTTGKTQLGWALEAAAAYRAAHPERYGGAPGVTDSVTVDESVTPSVTVSKGAERARRFRAKRRAVLAQE